MPEVIGIDHIYLSVTDMAKSEPFYDSLMGILGFRKNEFPINEQRHVQYYNRHFGYVLRPARPASSPHDSYSPGLHHICFRVNGLEDIREAAAALKAAGIVASEPKHFPEYAPDYYTVFLSDPDGIRLEITNYREERRNRHDEWAPG
jgi:catechol 2,3-dioxygenase-like lactoylglutathione lyase family enzyme